MHTPSHQDLVLLALGALPPDEREAVSAAVARDGSLRRELDEIREHLGRYDVLTETQAEEALPPFRALEARLDADRTRRGHGTAVARLESGGARVRWAVAAAAVVLVAVGAWLWRGNDAPTERRDVPVALGAGLEVVGPDGAPWAGARDRLPHGARLTCSRPAQVRIADRVDVVLDAGATMELAGAAAVHLVGRASFDVTPLPGHADGPFLVATAQGTVRVLGTVFEVDVREGLDVQVSEGEVDVDGVRLQAGERLRNGTRMAMATPGAWFRQPRIDVVRATEDPLVVGEALRFHIHIVNPGHLPIRVPGPAAGSGLSVELWRVDESADRLPITITDGEVESGGHGLQTGRPLTLEPEGRRTLGVRLQGPIRTPGSWRMRVWYRAEDEQTQIPSAVLAFEVTR